MSNFYAAIEIGTTRTVLAIGEEESDGRLKITCHAEIPSTGVRKSQILDIKQATSSIKSVLYAIEKKQSDAGSKITLGNAYLVVSGQHIKTDHYQGMVPIEGSKVGSEELDEVFRSSRAMQIPKDREFLDIVDSTPSRYTPTATGSTTPARQQTKQSSRYASRSSRRHARRKRFSKTTKSATESSSST